MKTKNHIYYFSTLLVVLFTLHFRFSETWKRDLIDYDDTTYIAALKGMSLGQYFGDWIQNPDNFAFPARDLTFAIDFFLSDLLGFNTFWLFNFFYFGLGLFFVFQSMLFLHPTRGRLAICVLAIFSLHPFMVEVIHWASLRKHLLVFTLLSAATFLLLRIKKLKTTDLVQIFGLYILSLLCWPTGILWIFWALWILRDKFRDQEAKFYLLAAASSGVAIFYYSFLTPSSSYYGQGQKNILTNFGIAVFNLTHSLGRGFFDLLLPFYLVPASNPEHFSTRLGMAALLGLTLFVAYGMRGKIRAQKVAQLKNALPFVILPLCFLIPPFLTVASAKDFVWSDRFLFLPLIMSSQVVFLGFVKWPKVEKLTVPASALATVYFLISSFYIPEWNSAHALFDNCYLRDGSKRCLLYSVERAFDKGGCALATQQIDKLRSIPEVGSNEQIEHEIPFFESYCAANTLNWSLEKKLTEISSIRKRSTSSLGVDFNQILVELSEGNKQDAVDLLYKKILDPKVTIPVTTTRVVNLYRGMVRAICESNVAPENCASLALQFEFRSSAAREDKQVQKWAYDLTRKTIQLRGLAGE